jgi:hypothetical protein
VVAKNGIGSARQHGGHPAAVPGEQATAYRAVDAAMDLAEPAELQSVVDRAAPNAKL